MRWIKHLTSAHSDKALAKVCEEHGPIASGIYWRLVEDIAGPMEPGKMIPEASHSVVKWASILDTSTRTFTKICKSLQTESLIFCETIEDRLKISIPNILKYKDEYSQRSGVTPVLSRERADTEQIQSKQEHPLPPQGGLVFGVKPERKTAVARAKPEEFPESEDFKAFYAAYWRHVGRGPAWSAYRTHVHNGDASKVMAAMLEERPVMLDREEDKRPHPATWLNQRRWRDREGLAEVKENSPYHRGSILDDLIPAQFKAKALGK